MLDTAPPAPRRWEIFCNVVDHFGDVGVSWRLARQLAAEHGLQIRLWVDDLATFHQLWPQVDPAQRRQWVEGVDIRHWTPEADPSDIGDVVVEAFGSRLSDGCLEAMAARTPRPVWINLEYLSAEDWVPEFHGRVSPHPRLPLTKYFFFPGVTAGTGGVLRERALDIERNAFLHDQESRAGYVTTVSLFGYGGPSVSSLLDAWSGGPDTMLALVPESRLLPDVARFFGQPRIQAGDRFERGNLSVLVLPFQRQDLYDRLLWRCDCNFVRGEDSFVRAQWAERPLVWNIYPQDNGAHWGKLHAFSQRYSEDLDDTVAASIREFWRLWNRGETSATVLGTAWQRLWIHRDTLQSQARRWAGRLREIGDLASNLVDFTRSRL
ncbi:MAG: elongation factor P maturation arginine rhamnosyltransferase EarP [Burkholderiales bacterium]|nr:elongation factor P maturation arginine rhamnosyltransferase EarP [Burkholderiales bacterium]